MTRPNTKSRRTFIKNVGGAAIGAAAVSTTAGVSSGCAGRAQSATATYDWICVGSNIEGGLQAAIFGHDQGFKTLLVEESVVLGGGGGAHGLFFVPGNHLMKEAGIPDSREEAVSWLQYVGGGYNSMEFIDAFVDNVGRAVEYLHRKAGVKLWMTASPDFWHGFSDGGWRLNESIKVGSKKHGRSLTVEPFPAPLLGDWRHKIRLSEYHHHLEELLEGQEHNPSLSPATKGKRTIGDHVGVAGPLRGEETLSLGLWRQKYGAAKVDALLKKDEEQYVAGPGIAAWLLHAMLQRGVEVRTETRPERLLVEDGRVVGVVVSRQGREDTLRARRGVMLGTGLSANAWRLGAGAAGEVHAKIRIPALGTIQVQEKPGDMGSRGNYEIRMRHSMFVNRFGQRFANEEVYQGVGTLLHFDTHGEHRFKNIPSYFIFDHNLIEKYSFGGRPPGATEGLEWLAQGQTIGELANTLKIPAAALEATVARFNEHARRGQDPDFHRTAGTLGPLEKPPFYGTVAHREAPETDPLRAQICLVTDTNGQVIHYRTKKPIPGLYGTTQLQEHQGLIGIGYQAGLHMAMGTAFSLLSAEHAARTA